LQNAQAVKLDGVDFNVRFAQHIEAGSLSYGLNASYLLKYEDTLLAGLDPIERLDTQYYPTKLRVRGSVAWSSPGWSSALFANYVNSYTNNQNPAAVERVSSWTTFDGQVSYVTSATNSFLYGARVSLSVQNIFDRQPPFVRNVGNIAGVGASPTYNYDAVNASLLGRYVSLQLGTRW
jgi:hypothetical protein